MQEVNRDRLDSEAIDYKMADIQLGEESKEPPHTIDSDSQQQDSQSSNGKESSFNELIAKWEPTVTVPKKAKQQNVNMSEEEKTADNADENCEEPNLKFVNAFDNFSSFIKAAGFIEEWIRTKKNNPTDFANDFPAILNRGLLIRKILLHLRKESNGAVVKDKNGAVVNPEVK